MDSNIEIIRGGGYEQRRKRLLAIVVTVCAITFVSVIGTYFFPINSDAKSLTVCFYGDSITELGHWGKIVDFRVNFQEMYLCGIGSTSFTSSDLLIYLDDDGNYCGRSNVDDAQPDNTVAVDGALSSSDRIMRTIPSDADVVFVMAGTNDWSLDVKESEFKNAVMDTINGIKSWLGEDVTIVLMSPLSGRKSDNNGEAINGIGLATSDYARFIKSVAYENGLYFIDIFNQTMIEQWNRALFLKDNVHPNYLGELEIERVVTKWIDANY